MVIKRNHNGDVTFIYNPGGKVKQVYLAGDFNDWDTRRRRMARMPDGSYRARMHLEAGEYEYKFVVDNVWTVDPDVEQKVLNTFGDFNSLVCI